VNVEIENMAFFNKEKKRLKTGSISRVAMADGESNYTGIVIEKYTGGWLLCHMSSAVTTICWKEN